jgi:LysR family transcriptional regulator, regulator for genes of the gallate degradation pathway
MNFNLRHLRVFLAVVRTSSITRAADECGLSQPAATQAINKLEREMGSPLFERTAQSVLANQNGRMLAQRVERALDIFESGCMSVAPRLRVTATSAQLRCFVAVAESGSFTLAARRLAVAQPTVHRAVARIEAESSRPLLERTSTGIIATRAGLSLARATHLTFAELQQARMEMAALCGSQAGRIVVGAMPLSRAHVLPHAVAAFRKEWPRIELFIKDGPYGELIQGLLRGEIDFLIGALREPQPIADIEQVPLFEDTLVVVARHGHALADEGKVITIDELRAYPWAVAAAGTPTYIHFEGLFTQDGGVLPQSVVETGSLVFISELLLASDHLACVSKLMVQREIAAGRLVRIAMELQGSNRRIGMTTRKGWVPTQTQRDLIACIKEYK